MGEGAEAPGHPRRPREPEAERGDLRSWQPRAGDPPRRAPDVWRAGRAEGPAGLVYRHEAGGAPARPGDRARRARRSEEHTSELQSRLHLVCRLLLEKKKKQTATT